MDFSTSSNGKKKLSCTSYAPVPAVFREALLKTGILFHVYYDNIPSVLKHYDDIAASLRRFPYYCLLQLLEGDAFFYNGSTGETSYFESGSGLIVPPGLDQQYGGHTRTFVEDSICFTGPLADLLYRNGMIRPGIFCMGGERRLLPVLRAIQEGTLSSLIEAAAMLVQLLLQLDRERRTEQSEQKPRLTTLLARLNESPSRAWSVEEVADYLNISTNSLRKLFLSQQGMSPKHYLDQLWLRQATDLLCATNRPLLEIAVLMKCADPYYFFRRFRKLSGYSPAQYRKLFRKQT